MNKKIIGIVITFIAMFSICFPAKAVYNGSGSMGGGTSGSNCLPGYACFYNNTADAYKLTFIYYPGSGDWGWDYIGKPLILWSGDGQVPFQNALEAYANDSANQYPILSGGNYTTLKNKISSLEGGGSSSEIEKWISENDSVRINQLIEAIGLDPKKVFNKKSDKGIGYGKNGYRIIVEKLVSVIQNGNIYVGSRKELANRSNFTSGCPVGMWNVQTNSLCSFPGELYLPNSDINVVSVGSDYTYENLKNYRRGAGLNIINFDPPYQNYNYSIDAACENCTNTLSEANGSYFIQDTTNWEAIKESVNNETSNVKNYYKKGNSSVVCREEYKVTFPNANNNILVKNGQYFTAGMIAPQIGHPNFTPIKVKRTMQCKDINGGATQSLQNFAKTELKSAGSISLNYVEGSSVDKLVSKNSNVYNIKSGDYAGDDYSYKTATIKENKTTKTTKISGDTATIELESYYTLPDELYQYIKKNGKSEVKKPTSNLENYINVGVSNLPISFENKVTQYKNLAAVVKLSYKLPKDNSKMYEAWDKGNASYFGEKNTDNEKNVYAKNVDGESIANSACAKLYGQGTSGFNTCVAKRQTDKMGDCKSVNENDYVCPIQSFGDREIKSCKKIEKNNCKLTLKDGSEVAIPCTSVNSGECIYNASCQKLSEKTCRITEEGETKEIDCKEAENLFPEGCPYETKPNRCQTQDDFKTCELQTFVNGKWQYIKNSRKDCSVYAKKYKTCPQGPGTATGGSIKDLIYRPIDLNVPFPGMSGIGRETGNNWCDSEGHCTTGTSYSVQTNITNNRGKTTDNVYSETPMYSFVLDGTKIRQIKTYNNSHDYSDFTLKCEKDGTACTSEFIRKYSPTGLCAGVSGKNNFYKCKYGLTGQK